jgi:hypothetical protein
MPACEAGGPVGSRASASPHRHHRYWRRWASEPPPSLVPGPCFPYRSGPALTITIVGRSPGPGSSRHAAVPERRLNPPFVATRAPGLRNSSPCHFTTPHICHPFIRHALVWGGTGGAPLPPRHPPRGFRRATAPQRFVPQSRHRLTPACSGLASLAADAYVRSQPEVWCSCHVSRSSEQPFTARGPARGTHERSTPQASSVSRYGALRIGPRALSREQHANRPAHLLTPCLRFSAPCPHFASGRAPIGPSRLVSRRNRSQGGNAHSFSLSIVLASGPSVGFPLQSPAGAFEAIGRHA